MLQPLHSRNAVAAFTPESRGSVRDRVVAIRHGAYSDTDWVLSDRWLDMKMDRVSNRGSDQNNVRPRLIQRSAVRFEGEVRPISLVLHLENFTFERNFDDASIHLVFELCNIRKGLMRRNERRKST
jgi:hypothetical protein